MAQDSSETIVEVCDPDDVLYEYVKRLQNLTNEKSEIDERIKELKEEFKDRIDMSEFNRARRIVKAENDVRHKSEFDQILDVLRTKVAVVP